MEKLEKKRHKKNYRILPFCAPLRRMQDDFFSAPLLRMQDGGA